jgi:hypothetical protein
MWWPWYKDFDVLGHFCAECLQLSISGLDLDARRRGPSDMVARRGFDGPKVSEGLDLCPKNFHSAIFDLALPHLARGVGNVVVDTGAAREYHGLADPCGFSLRV